MDELKNDLGELIPDYLRVVIPDCLEPCVTRSEFHSMFVYDAEHLINV
jgi:hypothetical protein